MKTAKAHKGTNHCLRNVTKSIKNVPARAIPQFLLAFDQYIKKALYKNFCKFISQAEALPIVLVVEREEGAAVDALEGDVAFVEAQLVRR